MSNNESILLRYDQVLQGKLKGKITEEVKLESEVGSITYCEVGPPAVLCFRKLKARQFIFLIVSPISQYTRKPTKKDEKKMFNYAHTCQGKRSF